VKEPERLLAVLEQAQPEMASAILKGLARGWPRDRRPELSPALEQTLALLFSKLPPAAKSQVASLAMRWGSQKLGDQIAAMAAASLEAAGKGDLSDSDRLASATQFVELQKSDSAATKLLDLITPKSSPELASGLVDALGKSESPAVGVALAGRLPKLTPAVRQAALRVLLSRHEWTASLLAAIQQGQLQLADLSLDQKQALANHPDRQLANRARRLLEAGGSLPNPDRQKVLDEMGPLVEQPGGRRGGQSRFQKSVAPSATRIRAKGQKLDPT